MISNPCKSPNKHDTPSSFSDKRNRPDTAWIKKTVLPNENISVVPSSQFCFNDKSVRAASTRAVDTEKLKTIAKKFGGRKIQRVGPSPEDHNKFRWAYETWYQAGLMKEKVSYKNKDGNSWPHGDSENRADSPSSSAKENRVRNEASIDFGNDSASASSSLSTGDEPAPSKLCSNIQDMPPEEIDRMPSSDSADHKGFQRLLDMWREQSKDKQSRGECLTPSSAVISPSRLGIDERTKIDDNDKDCLVENSINALTIPKCEQHQNSTPQKWAEVSAISGISSDLVPYNSGSTEDRLVKSGSFVGSQICERLYNDEEEINRALVIVESNDRNYDVMVGETQKCIQGQLVIRNLENLGGNRRADELIEYNRCDCSGSVFSGNDDLISFFLPQMGMACTCGRRQRGLINPEDPTAIENVLRPWQCEFLRSFGIFRGEQLVKARHRSANIMARALRNWRKKYGLAPFKTSSCGMAIDIWAKTCKAYVRSIRKQIRDGNQYLQHDQSGPLANELSHFLNALPEAPRKRAVEPLSIEPDSQVEV